MNKAFSKKMFMILAGSLLMFALQVVTVPVSAKEKQAPQERKMGDDPDVVDKWCTWLSKDGTRARFGKCRNICPDKEVTHDPEGKNVPKGGYTCEE